MKKFFLLLLTLSFSIAYSMSKKSEVSELHESLEWLTKDTSPLYPESAVYISMKWGKGMSFLERYMNKSFNECDIYKEAVFFNECTYSADTYKMEYTEIKNFLNEVSNYIPLITASGKKESKDKMQAQYCALILKWRDFDAHNPLYRQTWASGDFNKIRAAIRSK